MTIHTGDTVLDSEGKRWKVISWGLIIPDDQMALTLKNHLGVQVTVRERDLEVYFKEE